MMLPKNGKSFAEIAVVGYFCELFIYIITEMMRKTCAKATACILLGIITRHWGLLVDIQVLIG